MSFSTMGPRPPASPIPPATAQTAGKAVATPMAPATGITAAQLRTVDPVTPQDDVVSLSRLGLQARVERSASASESAQNFISGIARKLFGEQAQTSTVAYNLQSARAPVSTDAGNAANVRTDVRFDPGQSAGFTGIGQIVTEEGQTFDFEVAVKYQPSRERADPPRLPPIEPPDVLVLTGKPLPAIEFPGSLNDLFKLLSRELRTDVEGNGNLTLRLQRLVDRAALLAPRARPDDPELTPADRAKAVASTYASTYGSGAAASIGDLSKA